MSDISPLPPSPSNLTPSPTMTVREVATYLRLTESTVYKLLAEGTLPGKKIGGQWRLSRAAIENWLMPQATAYG